MQKIDFNKDWICRCLTRDEEAYPVTLPHDAMLSEPRTQESTGEGNVGWYIGGDYEYTKNFFVPEEYKDKKVLIEFEGIYHNGEVYINGKKAAYRPYGYTNFYVDTEGFFQYGKENEIKVIARNADQPNSRWYSGTGIYRPAYLHVAGEKYIPVNGVKIRTLSYDPAKIEVVVKTSAPGEVSLKIEFEGSKVLRVIGESTKIGNVNNDRIISSDNKNMQPNGSVQTGENGQKSELVQVEAEKNNQAAEYQAIFQLDVPNAKLWDTEHPNLYTCKAVFGEDEVIETFGIRELIWNPQVGMTINGERVILRGACFHHDNGVLGACTYPEAEERKMRILKENGYNAVRSAHYPCSKALLDACDRMGMLMMDEYVDVWYIHKTKYDYAGQLADWWKQDLKDMVDKDYNHPSVIMYSTGNEVAETAQKKGIALTGDMTNFLHSLDSTRPVTCGINIFFNFLSSIGLGVYSDDKAEKSAGNAEKNAAQATGKNEKKVVKSGEKTVNKATENGKKGLGSTKPEKKKKPVGSEFYNTLACLVGDYFMKCGATLYPCDLRTKDAYANMDIAGYNYGIFRYKHDLKKYPNRLILGSETFCKDAYSFWEIAKKNKRIIGDFVWAGWDYIGEVGDGAAEYSDYKFEDPATRMTGGNGRIDLNGKPRAEAAYTRVAFERETGPFIAVDPVYQKEKLRLTGWQLTKALESWAWDGCNGEPAKVEVYARAAQVELFINGKSVGKKKVKKCRANFNTTYQDGEITAVSYDENGKEINRYSLQTAGKDTVLQVRPEEKTVKPEGLAFIQLQYTDSKGIWKPMEKHNIKVTVENGVLKGLGSPAPYVKGNYTDHTVATYYGEAMAVVQADGNGPVKVTVADEERFYVAEIPCE
ncbi:glycoside hydrolase family 2 TIM barrel-domain containing protein [Blautia faecis]|uniref:glycoside hydrolase family 2 TIM barrel-domain containing protein n=1 Tax=Blautia faecis TaxID=871665 RepID=UPI001F321B71|nr:glycoside hydrolase family 2 TIM barrel-domain containing protein [Blautia faecis]